MDSIAISFTTPLRVLLGSDKGAAPRAITTFQFDNYIFTGENMAATMSVGTIATVSVQWKDAGGNIVAVEKGTVKWASSDDTIARVEVSTGNPQIANVYAEDNIGTVQIQASGDADLGSGVQTVTASIDGTVIGGQAVGGDITFTQSPQQKPPVGPGGSKGKH